MQPGYLSKCKGTSDYTSICILIAWLNYLICRPSLILENDSSRPKYNSIMGTLLEYIYIVSDLCEVHVECIYFPLASTIRRIT